ncbi:MAG: hypothetical protein OQJ81_03590, partial [Melioribacteraceae bacterium]|nr:hypothetical protein [Melioribacteraceae bacterium]
MSASRFNFHKILFTLETFSTPEEKISYLFSIKVDVNRVIKCFSTQKTQALKKYVVKNIFAEDGCDELSIFLKEVMGYYNSPQYGDRNISDEILKRHMKEEVIKYKNFLKEVDSEIEYWVIQRDKNNSKIENKSDVNMNDLKNIDSEILEEKINADASSTSMRELLERKQKKITWKGSKEDLIYFFDQLFSQQLLRTKSYDEIFSIVSHYFVDENGEAILIEKSASAKMNLNGPKIPE